jgi:hypothetical protein
MVIGNVSKRASEQKMEGAIGETDVDGKIQNRKYIQVLLIVNRVGGKLTSNRNLYQGRPAHWK